jgi:signal peptidase I
MASIAGSADSAGPVPHDRAVGPWLTLTAIRAARRVLAGLWLISLAVVVVLALATNLGPKLGFEVFAIRGGSMTPAIPLGAAVFAIRTDPDSIQVGDTVTIRADNGVVYTHRVVEVDASEADHWLRTKGDANTTADAAPVPVASVVGVVGLSVPLAGYLMVLLGTPAGIVSFLAYAAALLLAVWELEEAEAEAKAGVGGQRRVDRSADVAPA